MSAVESAEALMLKDHAEACNNLAAQSADSREDMQTLKDLEVEYEGTISIVAGMLAGF